MHTRKDGQGGHVMDQMARYLVATALLFSWQLSCYAQLEFAAANQPSFIAYSCQHKSSAEVTALLRPLVGNEAGVQIVVDKDNNRFLLAGPDHVHQIAGRLLAEVDRPTTQTRVDAVPSMRSYKLPARLQQQFVTQIQSRYPGIRVSADPASDSLFVWTDSSTQAAIGRLLQQVSGGSQTPGSTDPKVQFREPAIEVAPPRPIEHVQRHQFVTIPRGQLDRLQNQLLAIFRSRITVQTVGARQVFVITMAPSRGATSTNQQVELEFDQARSGILLGADEKIANQFVALVDSLVRPDTQGRRAKVFRLRRDRHQQLKDALFDGSLKHAPRGTASGLELSAVEANPGRGIIHRFPTPEQALEEAAGGIRLVRYLFQDAEYQLAQANQEAQTPEAEATSPQLAPTQLAPQNTLPLVQDSPATQDSVRQFEGVEIESLPDLDVIILRGTDQDLEQLAEIIRQLERISKEAQPEIRIYQLEHAQSQAISEILDQIGEELVSGRQGEVSTVPLVKPNAILIIGWGEAVAATEKLLKELDTPVSPESQSKVFRLKHAAATQVQQTLQSFFANRGGLGPRLQLATDSRTNSVIVYAAPRDMAEVTALIRDMDRPDGEAVNRARVIPIENALAADVAETLQQAIQAAAGNGDRAASLELQTFDAEGQRLLRSGNLSDVRITPNVRNNTLIISSPMENFELLVELVRQLDTPTSSAKIKVFRIVNGDATALVQTLRSLIPSQTGGTAGTPQLSGTGEAGLAPLRFSVDIRSNSIIATGAEGDLRIVEALLAKLDQTNSMQRQTAVYRLRNSPAIDVANAVNQYLFNRRQLENAAPGQDNPFAEIEREVVVVPEPIANKLILAATPRYFPEIKELIEKLDESPPQVIIQVLIAEVALNNADEFGVELGLQDSVLFDRSLLGDLLTTSVTEQTSTAAGIVSTTQDLVQAATNIPGFAFNSPQPLGNSGSSTALNNAADIGGQAISNFSLGRQNDQLGFGGLVLSASSKNVSVLLRALRESRRVDVLSRPQIRTLDNQPAYIQVGQRVPRIVGSTVNQNGQSNSVQLENVGLILGVTPRVSPDGTVVMEIDAEKSALGPEQEGIPVAVSVDGTVIRSPRVDTTTAQATVSATDGETIVLGGLITENSQYVHRSVPVLGEIPILEHLFRFDSQIQRRTELLIILTPHVIRSTEDNERMRQMEMARMSWCACDVFSLMDDIGYQPETTYDHVETGAPEVIYPALNPAGDVEQLVPPEPALRTRDLSPSGLGNSVILGDPGQLRSTSNQ